MTWMVAFHEAFDPEFEQIATEVQDELLAHAKLLAQFGPSWDSPGWTPSKDHATPI